MLPSSGTLTLELPLAHSNIPDHVEKFSRRVDSSPCHFPSQYTIEKWLTETGFTLHKKAPSVVQPGTDRNPRYCYLLEK